MQRRLVLAIALASSQPALAEDIPLPSDAQPSADAQGIGAAVGMATGSHLTPGGVRIAGHYTYRVTDVDWFDGTVAFTFGSSAHGCRTDPMSGDFTCDHGLIDGRGVELAAGVRHELRAQGQFTPFVRAGLGLGLVRFTRDDVTGGALDLHAGGGLHVEVADAVRIVAEADAMLGGGVFSHTIGASYELGFAVLGGVEFRIE